MSVPFRIRVAGPGDVAAIESVRVAGWRVAYRGLVPDEILDNMSAGDAGRADGVDGLAARREALARPGVFALLAEDAQLAENALLAEDEGGAPAGYCVGGPDRDLPYGGEIYALYVLPEHWSTGLGRELLRHGVGALQAAGYTDGCLWVLEGNARARRFYERAGLTATGERRMLDMGRPVPELRYRIDLEVSV